MASKDLVHDIKAVQCIAAAAVTATATGTAIDTSGYEGVTFIINAGAGLTTSNKFTVTLLEGDVSNSLTAITSEDYLGESFDITAAGTYKIGYRGVKRYVAVKLTVTGTVNTPVGVSAILSSPRVAPIA